MTLIAENGSLFVQVNCAMLVKSLAIIVFLAIVASLGSALYHLVKGTNEEESKKTAKALTIRIGLSLFLFLMLFVAFATGIFEPQGLGARIQQIRIEHSLNPKP